MKPINRINQLFDQHFLEKSNRQKQLLLAPELRAMAINHLRHSDSVVAKNFRGEYSAVYSKDYDTFLHKQSRDRSWGTYIEATALAAELGVNLVVTPVTKGKTQAPICLYRASDDSAPTIELYNSDNTHWYVDGTTMGDGNCLYNGFAQALEKMARASSPMPQQCSQWVRPLAQQTGTLFSAARPHLESNVVNHQRAIERAISKAPTPAQVERQLMQEQGRISRLPLAEQKQIQGDYRLALKIAAGEYDTANSSRSYSF